MAKPKAAKVEAGRSAGRHKSRKIEDSVEYDEPPKFVDINSYNGAGFDHNFKPRYDLDRELKNIGQHHKHEVRQSPHHSSHNPPHNPPHNPSPHHSGSGSDKINGNKSSKTTAIIAFIIIILIVIAAIITFLTFFPKEEKYVEEGGVCAVKIKTLEEGDKKKEMVYIPDSSCHNSTDCENFMLNLKFPEDQIDQMNLKCVVPEE